MALSTVRDMEETFSNIVGTENISTDDETLKKYSSDTSMIPPKMPDMIVRVKNREEVMAALQKANENSIPVTPRSSKTGTYGTGIPEEGGIILDLSSMKRIPRVDTRNRWVLIEPGVTFGELKEELSKHGMQPLNPLLPRKDKSVITSVLEREPVLTTKTECDEPFRTAEIVWGTGALFRTGAMSVDTMPAEEIPVKTKSDLCSVGGPGIDWWRLMTGTQGTFGVVTIMNVKIFHKPLLQKVIFLPFEKLQSAVMPLYTIQRREIGHECFILNNYAMAAITADTDKEIAGLALRLPRYTIVLNLWGGQFFPEERIAYEENAVTEIASQYKCTVTDILGPLADAAKLFERKLTSPWEDVPYWKEREKGGCLEIIFESGLDKVPQYWQLFRQLAAEHGISTNDLGLYIQPRQRCRVCHVEFHIPCDPENTANLRVFHKYASEVLLNAGAFFYRPYYDWAEMIYARSGYTHETIKKLKKILDPNRTLNPGKLKL